MRAIISEQAAAAKWERVIPMDAPASPWSGRPLIRVATNDEARSVANHPLWWPYMHESQGPRSLALIQKGGEEIIYFSVAQLTEKCWTAGPDILKGDLRGDESRCRIKQGGEP